MTCDVGNTSHDAACAMLEAFASVGADTFDLTITNRQGAKVQFRGAVPLEHLRRAVPAQLDAADRLERNVIVRPHGPAVVFIQLDDLTHAGIERLRPAAFLGLETSPENYQAWVAMRQIDDELAWRLRKGTGADPAASGATRIAGSLNFKEKYAPDFPRVKITYTSPGHVVSKETLSQLGLIVGSEQAPSHILRTVRSPGARRWPSYQRCIVDAPPAREGSRPDISRADFTWCMIAIDWGWSVEEAAARLMEYSPKARENGKRYAVLTAGSAAEAVGPRRGLS